MSSKVNLKFCWQLSFLTNFRRPPGISRLFSGIAASPRCHFQDNSRVPLHPPLLGASLQSLPGNRSPIIPMSHGIFRMKTTVTADSKISWNLGAVGIENIEDYTSVSDEQLQQAIAHQINVSVENGTEGRLYAVVHVRSLQYKVTPGDIIIVKHDFPPNVGDKIRLEKVLAVGGPDFTLFGQPLLSRNKVFVEATVVERTLSHNRVWFMYLRRQNFKRFHLYRERHTMLLINSIRVTRLDDHKQIEEDKRDANQES